MELLVKQKSSLKKFDEIQFTEYQIYIFGGISKTSKNQTEYI